MSGPRARAAARIAHPQNAARRHAPPPAHAPPPPPPPPRRRRVQEATLQKLLAGQDCLVKAKTGGGKTLAFLIPAVERLRTLPATGGARARSCALPSPLPRCGTHHRKPHAVPHAWRALVTGLGRAERRLLQRGRRGP